MLGFTEMFLRNYSSFNFFNCCDLCCLFKIGINPWDQTVFCSFVLSLCYNGFSLNVWKVMYSRPFLCLWQNSHSFHWGHISAHWERFCCIGELLDHVEIIVLENGIWEKNIRKECLRSSWKPEIRKEHRNKHGPLQKLCGEKRKQCVPPWCWLLILAECWCNTPVPQTWNHICLRDGQTQMTLKHFKYQHCSLFIALNDERKDVIIYNNEIQLQWLICLEQIYFNDICCVKKK